MSKKLLLSFFIFFCLQFTLAKAQWVTIPDGTFANWLTNNYPNCMNFNQLDTTCFEIINEDSITISNLPTILTGIEYFDSLKYLKLYNISGGIPVNLPKTLLYLQCNVCQAYFLPNLPNTLTTLNCANNPINDISNLPPNLKYLKCNNTNIDSLPILPNQLINLTCDTLNLTSLPNLPNTLTVLNCQQNLLSVLPVLPDSLHRLCFGFNQINNLPSLPVTLDTLSFDYNLISSLPQFPPTLKYLSCHYNQLNNLPSLPNTLTYLKCSNNSLTSIPIFPAALKRLNCEANQINNLGTLPDSMINLRCGQNQIPNILSFPSTLDSISCGINLLGSLPQLPSHLKYLECLGNQLNNLPTLPNELITLICRNNQLTTLPTLPNSLKVIECNLNQITSLPSLPDSLKVLECWENLLTTLPTLPNSLIYLGCSHNMLTSLPAIPSSLDNLSCADNNLTSIPPVPNFMSRFDVGGNDILCLSNLPQVTDYGSIGANPITCVPNQTSYSLGKPLCVDNDLINNPNNCTSANLTGNIYTNLDSNCIYNSSDWQIENVKVNLFDFQNNLIAQSYTTNGVYSFSVPIIGNYLIKLDSLMPLSIDCGQQSAQNATILTSNQTISSIDFPVICDSVFDLRIHSINSTGIVFPGQTHTLNSYIYNQINWYNLNCVSTNFYGTVSVDVNGPVSYFSVASGALSPIVNGNSFTYNISDFNSLTPESFGLKFLTDTTAQAGDQICVHVEINPTPLDADTTNNSYDFCYQVVNSYDPNMKEVYPVNVLPGYDDWFTYTIHFQNTGNAPAFNIRLRDTLDTNLDINSFEVRGYSHPTQISLNGNILTVRFNNIMLPDSTTDYEGSMGYFQYRLKPLPNLPNGTQIENTAYIYFDYNAPIITNTTQNNFEFPVKVNNLISENQSFVLYPNPSAGIFMFKDNKNIKSVEVFNMMGELVLSQGNAKLINLQGSPKGIYVARVNGTQVCRLVKE